MAGKVEGVVRRLGTRGIRRGWGVAGGFRSVMEVLLGSARARRGILRGDGMGMALAAGEWIRHWWKAKRVEASWCQAEDFLCGAIAVRRRALCPVDRGRWKREVMRSTKFD